MLIVNLKECTDNVLISDQFHVQSRLNRLYNNYYFEISYNIHIWVKLFRK